MTSIASEMKRPVLWTPGDWNAFFGFGTNMWSIFSCLPGCSGLS